MGRNGDRGPGCRARLSREGCAEHLCPGSKEPRLGRCDRRSGGSQRAAEEQGGREAGLGKENDLPASHPPHPSLDQCARELNCQCRGEYFLQTPFNLCLPQMTNKGVYISSPKSACCAPCRDNSKGSESLWAGLSVASGLRWNALGKKLFL